MLRAAESTSKTDTGRQRRENEDCAFARAPLFAVADGMGGAQAGEVAAKLAIDAFEQGLPDTGPVEERLADRVREANRRIYELARAEHGHAGMGTTLTVAYLDDTHLAIAHVGDSRAYLYRDGELSRLTHDHSLVDELVRRGKLTEEQAAEHPQRSIITRALGPEPSVEVDTLSYPVRGGDLLLLCSDGLTSMVSEDRVAEVLASSQTLEEASDRLIAEANEAGGRDNITVVLFRLEEVGSGETADETTMVGTPAPSAPAEHTSVHDLGPAVVIAPHATGAPLPRMQPRQDAPAAEPTARRFRKPLAVLIAALIVLFLIGGGGYLASRQLYFVGTNPQGLVTIYRGLPYDLPAGIPLYEKFYVSGVPASLVPADRRSSVLDNRLRSQSDAESLVRDIELGRLSR
jgi:protein phosphatase